MSTGQTATLTTSPIPGDAEPKWAPDGKSIYFTSGRNPAEGFAIYRMNADGSQQTPVAKVDGRNTINTLVSVNSTGGQLAFHTNRDGNMEIYVTNMDGSSPQNLTQNQANDITASWSPDGKVIIFASDRNGNEYQLFTMNADGSNVTALAPRPGTLNYAPKYSPDGKRFVFLTRPSSSGAPQIAVAQADGSNVQIITNGFDMHTRPIWMDNSTIIYASRVSDAQHWSIYMLNLDTHVRTPLLSGTTSYTDPDWIP
jgi:TolB protein